MTSPALCAVRGFAERPNQLLRDLINTAFCIGVTYLVSPFQRPCILPHRSLLGLAVHLSQYSSQVLSAKEKRPVYSDFTVSYLIRGNCYQNIY